MWSFNICPLVLGVFFPQLGIFLWFVHIFNMDQNFIFFMTEECSMGVCAPHLFIHSSVDRHLGYFHLLLIWKRGQHSGPTSYTTACIADFAYRHCLETLLLETLLLCPDPPSLLIFLGNSSSWSRDPEEALGSWVNPDLTLTVVAI